MEVHHGYKGVIFNRPVVTMGVFDGVHLGHRMLLERVVKEAEKSGTDSVAVTFEPHPRMVLQDDPSDLRFLTDLGERINLLRETGIGHLVIIPFTIELSRMTAPEFIESILCRQLKASHLITGFNHHFGRRHEGDTNTIIECSLRMDFRVTKEKALRFEGEPVSSSLIRKLLERGNVTKASSMLGYDYFLKGKVVSGRRIGRNIGFPTANIVPLNEHKLIPSSGVYAVEATIDDDPLRHIAMLNVGRRPTIRDNDGMSTIEVHIVDFEADLYGKNMTVWFHERLRDELKFDSIDDLAAQLTIDRERTIAVMRG